MTPSRHDDSPIADLESLLSRRRSIRSYSDKPIGSRAIQRILFSGQGITSGEGKRTAPSAHALYPLRLSVIVRRVEGLERGFYSYKAEDQTLHDAGNEPAPGTLLSASLADDKWLEEAAAVVVVGAHVEIAIQHFIEQQPDGKRGARYVDFEAGACMQNMYLAVAAQSLGAVVVMGFDDNRMKAALGLPGDIEPIALFCIGQPQAKR